MYVLEKGGAVMRFTMKGGVLTGQTDQQTQAVLKGALLSPKKRIYAKNGTLALWTDIRRSAPSQVRSGDVRAREYILLTPGGAEYATARPDHSKRDDVGWSGFRAPFVDHVHVFYGGNEYCLTADRDRNYALLAPSHRTVAEFRRKGPMSGWDVEAEDGFPAEMLCAIFAFCQYLRQENELHVV